MIGSAEKKDYQVFFMQIIAAIFLGGYAGSAIYLMLTNGDQSQAGPGHFVNVWAIEYKDIFNNPDLIIASIPLLAAIIVPAGTIGVKLFREPLYGTARFASRGDLKRMGLFSKSGVILGIDGYLWWKKYVIANDDFSFIVEAGQRSGKGVSFVVPNQLLFPGSVISFDIKGEGFQLTSGWRQKCGDRVICFSPMSGQSHCYNPLDFIHTDNRRINDIERIAFTLIKQPVGETPVFADGARELFKGLYLLLSASGGDCTIAEIYRLCRRHQNFHVWLISQLNDQGALIEPMCQESLNSFINRAPREQSAVLSTLQAGLSIFANPFVANATSRTDFDPSDFRRIRHSLYLVIPPADIDRLEPLINVMSEQMMGRLLDRLPDKEDRYKILFLADELPAFGKLEKIDNAQGYLASYGIIFAAIYQHRSMMIDTWGKESTEALIGNSKYRIHFGINDYPAAEAISKELGEKTVTRTTGGFFKIIPNRQVYRRPLKNPDEVRRLKKNKAIMIVRGEHPVLLRRLIYYKHSKLKKMILQPATIGEGNG